MNKKEYISDHYTKLAKQQEASNGQAYIPSSISETILKRTKVKQKRFNQHSQNWRDSKNFTLDLSTKF